MRKVCLVILAVMLSVAVLPVYATESFHLAGFDGDGYNRAWETNQFFKRFAEKFDITFTFSQFTEYDLWTREKASYLNGAELPEVLFKAELSTLEEEALYEKGVIVDLALLIEQHMPNLTKLLNENPQWRDAITLDNGVIPSLPSINTMVADNAIWINIQWLDNLKLEMPTDKDSFEKVLRAFKDSDANQNGKADEIPLTFLGMWDLKFLAHAYGLVANDYNIFVDETGTVKHLTQDDRFYSFVQWLAMLYKDGLLDQTGFATSDTVRQVTDEKATITYGMLFGNNTLNLMPYVDVKAYQIVPPLMYEGKRVYRDLMGEVQTGALALTSKCKNPEIIMAAIDYLYSEEGGMLAQAGVEGIDYQVNADGTWSWIADNETVANTILRDVAIVEGGTLPWYAPNEALDRFDNAETTHMYDQKRMLRQYTLMPYPQTRFEQATQSKIDALHTKLGACFEKHIGRFILGQVELNADNWDAFIDELDLDGLKELLVIFQNAIN